MHEEGGGRKIWHDNDLRSPILPRERRNCFGKGNFPSSPNLMFSGEANALSRELIVFREREALFFERESYRRRFYYFSALFHLRILFTVMTAAADRSAIGIECFSMAAHLLSTKGWSVSHIFYFFISQVKSNLCLIIHNIHILYIDRLLSTRGI